MPRLIRRQCRCGQPRRTGGNNCIACHATWMRLNRKPFSALTDEQRLKSNCRAYTRMLIKRGHLIPQPCEDCGSVPAEPHHDDYTKPRQVRWKCRAHHLAFHAGSKSSAAGS